MRQLQIHCFNPEQGKMAHATGRSTVLASHRRRAENEARGRGRMTKSQPGIPRYPSFKGVGKAAAGDTEPWAPDKRKVASYCSFQSKQSRCKCESRWLAAALRPMVLRARTYTKLLQTSPSLSSLLPSNTLVLGWIYWAVLDPPS